MFSYYYIIEVAEHYVWLKHGISLNEYLDRSILFKRLNFKFLFN